MSEVGAGQMLGGNLPDSQPTRIDNGNCRFEATPGHW